MSATDRGRGPRGIVARHFGQLVVALGVVAAAIALTAPGASASTPCAQRTFGLSDTYQPCVFDEQVLLNDLQRAGVGAFHKAEVPLLARDGYYGPNTARTAGYFNSKTGNQRDGNVTNSDTWYALCDQTLFYGFYGAAWHAAGCEWWFLGVRRGRSLAVD
jgi:peptidoglycan hydrolase-like protein with peptidoglycan-binding domain